MIGAHILVKENGIDYNLDLLINLFQIQNNLISLNRFFISSAYPPEGQICYKLDSPIDCFNHTQDAHTSE